MTIIDQTKIFVLSLYVEMLVKIGGLADMRYGKGDIRREYSENIKVEDILDALDDSYLGDAPPGYKYALYSETPDSGLEKQPLKHDATVGEVADYLGVDELDLKLGVKKDKSPSKYRHEQVYSPTPVSPRSPRAPKAPRSPPASPTGVQPMRRVPNAPSQPRRHHRMRPASPRRAASPPVPAASGVSPRRAVSPPVPAASGVSPRRAASPNRYEPRATGLVNHHIPSRRSAMPRQM